MVKVPKGSLEFLFEIERELALYVKTRGSEALLNSHDSLAFVALWLVVYVVLSSHWILHSAGSPTF